MKNYRVEKPKSQKSSIKRDENTETVLISINDFNQEEAKNEDIILPDFSTLSKDEFDMAKEVCLPLINNINNAANKHKPDRLKRHRNEDFTMSETKKDYTIGLMFNFVLNTAATIYIICNLDYFYQCEYTDKKVKQGKANTIYIKIMGSVLVKTNTGHILNLKEVYYIPELGINLLSIEKLDNIISIFIKERVILY